MTPRLRPGRRPLLSPCPAKESRPRRNQFRATFVHGIGGNTKSWENIMRQPLVLLRLLALLISIGAPAAAADEATTIRPITEASSVFAIYTRSLGISAKGLAPHRLIFAVWNDGRVVWSENLTNGGVPYHAGRVEPAKLHDALAKFNRDGLFEDSSLTMPRFGPDASTTIIFVKSNDCQLKMQSWHELYEAKGTVVATQAGLAPLGDRRLYEVLSEQPADYLFYRFVWNELRLAAATLIPCDREPIDGKLDLRAGKATWVERSSDAR